VCELIFIPEDPVCHGSNPTGARQWLEPRQKPQQKQVLSNYLQAPL